ncbi:MAG: cysteine desulfurase [Pirellulaceae bacterium]|nr:cysteine desulfurase [Pirellulaceae bacterium]
MSEHIPPTTAFGAVPSEDSSRAFLEQVLARFPGMAQSTSLPSEAPDMASLSAIETSRLPAHETACPGADRLHYDPSNAPDMVQRLAGHLSTTSLPKSVQEAVERADHAPQEHPIAFEHLRVTLQQAEVAQNELRRLSFAKQLGRGKLTSDRLVSGAHVPATAGRTPDFFAKPSQTLDVASVRSDFPALHQSINGHDLVWFDNAATTHKPQVVIDAMSKFYARDYSNIHRAAHTLAARATDHYESAREAVREFIHAKSANDIVFVRGTTEGINFIANVLGTSLQDGDEILLTEMEHHANIVPWQLIARQRGAKIRVIPFDDRGELMMDEYRRLLSLRTKVVSVTHASNTLGTILPVEEIGGLAHKFGAKYIIDGAQSVAHLPIDVTAMNCDFFVFSGHKVYAPTGIGAVYIRPEIQEILPPWQGGGNMIHRVTFDETTYAFPPNKFEAGTPSIGDAVGLEAALRYLRQFDIQAVARYEHSLLEHAGRELAGLEGVRLIGGAGNRTGLLSFVIDGLSTEHVGQLLDRQGIAVRTGHHCAQPSLRHFGLESTVRPSFAIYNTHAEIDRMVSAIRSIQRRR